MFCLSLRSQVIRRRSNTAADILTSVIEMMALVYVFLTRVFAFHLAYFPVDLKSRSTQMRVSHLLRCDSRDAIWANDSAAEVQLLSGVLFSLRSELTDRLTCEIGGPAHLQIAAVIRAFKLRHQDYFVVRT